VKKTLDSRNARIRWEFGIIAGIVLLFFGLYPQLRLWHERGENWQGAYAYNDLDEMAYAAYLQALIDDRPRRSDPYTGRDDSTENPQPESLFSIQFLPPFLLASIAKVFGASASTVLIFISPITAFFAALVLFWLIVSITNDSFYAFAATLFALCCGVLINGEGAVSALFREGFGYPYFPFLRRYVPAIPFPVFFLFCVGVWKLLTEEKRRVFWLLVTTASFAFQVYSYFYLWTTAAAFLACLSATVFVFKPENRQKILKTLTILGILSVLTLIPYFFLLSNRAATTDHVQLLVYTRIPDLLRPPLILSLITLSLLAFSAWRKFQSAKDERFIFAFALALVSIAVFNQQIITGRSLQPIHYQVFIVNYVTLSAFALAIFFVRRGRALDFRSSSRRFLPFVAAFAVCWGFAECYYNTWFLDDANATRDEAKFLGDRLTELAKTELFDENGNRRVTMNFNLLQGDDQPTVAPQAVLWARHLHVFSGASWEENKERLYQFYYYAGFDAFELERQFRESSVFATISFFGWGRHASRLTSGYKPLSETEIEFEARNYAEFCASYNVEKAARNKISYVITDSDYNQDFTNLDRWYERDAGERIGKFMLYRVKLKQN
jgi:hypothetical protein